MKTLTLTRNKKHKRIQSESKFHMEKFIVLLYKQKNEVKTLFHV